MHKFILENYIRKYTLFACAFNLLLGYTGLLSFGHAAFFGGAAYFTAHAVKEWGLPPELGLIVGMVGAALLGLLMGVLAIRRQGIYFAMVTLALSQMFFFFGLGTALYGVVKSTSKASLKKLSSNVALAKMLFWGSR